MESSDLLRYLAHPHSDGERVSSHARQGPLHRKCARSRDGWNSGIPPELCLPLHVRICKPSREEDQQVHQHATRCTSRERQRMRLKCLFYIGIIILFRFLLVLTVFILNESGYDLLKVNVNTFSSLMIVVDAFTVLSCMVLIIVWLNLTTNRSI
ncbi:hypothetical protein AU106_gp166 [Sinorhizobium phage phiM9]|uniref:Transmembrane protein n=1 Tax=Sinorhizobium phage phiM9 TaxID=1636182 RepID=A0A0F6R526_9CAUD|nr:hypothetical protein AU106_gp166 [Sinorhizobium phage phiM9]AKE44797.1 hypothetical protein Sm_phiM9_169 [Sinorhizobium phage phiM9]